MKKKFFIEKFEKFGEGRYNLFVIREEGEEFSEFEKLLMRYAEDETLKEITREIIRNIIKRISAMLKDGNIKPFLEEKVPSKDLYAISDTGFLRIFCLVKQNSIIIFGGGGEKTTRSYQEDDILNEPFQELLQISEKIDEMFSGFPIPDLLEKQVFITEVR